MKPLLLPDTEEEVEMFGSVSNSVNTKTQMITNRSGSELSTQNPRIEPPGGPRPAGVTQLTDIIQSNN